MMKHILFALIVLVTFACNTTKNLEMPANVSAEEGYELKISFQPNAEYVTDLEQVLKTTTSISGMPEQNLVSNTSSSSTLQFGPLKNNKCDMLIVYDKMDTQITGTGMEEFEQPDLNGMMVYGQLINGVQSIDSIVGGDQAINGMMENMLEPMFNDMKINFPNPMKIGDEFLDTKVTDIPIEGMGSTKFNTDTKYKLIKVENGLADLTTKTKIKGSITVMDNEFPIKGKGTGTMTIDLAKQYVTTTSAVIDQEMNMEMEGMTMMQKTSTSVSVKNQKVK